MGTIVKDMPPLPGGEETKESASSSNPGAGGTTASSTAAAAAFKDKDTTSPSLPSDSGENNPNSVATLSSPWEYDARQPHCTLCRTDFSPWNRRHHCRLCGHIFCHDCSNERALIPPSSIVLSPTAGKHAHPSDNTNTISFSPNPDPDRMLTYLDDQQHLLYGQGLEERFLLAREPLRVCHACHEQLQPLQVALQNSNSNAMRFNHIDPNDSRRFWNSPLAFTLGHEVRKAAYTLNNLLPLPRKMGNVIHIQTDTFVTGHERDLQECQQECQSLSPNLGNLDGVRIPARLLEEARGVAVMTVVKGGFGLAGVEFGTGLVVAKLNPPPSHTQEQQQQHVPPQWSAPCAIGTAGVSWGALIGAQISDHVFLLMNDDAVQLMFSNSNLQLGADVGVAVGPLGRALEADVGAAPGKLAPIYTYSQSKGLYAGISLDGKVIMARERVNEKFYGKAVSGRDILAGLIPTPPAARPLYEALQRCHVYASGNTGRRHSSTMTPPPTNTTTTVPVPPMPNHPPPVLPPVVTNNNNINNINNNLQTSMEYGEGMPPSTPHLPAPSLVPHNNTRPYDQRSYGGMSDITSDPGY